MRARSMGFWAGLGLTLLGFGGPASAGWVGDFSVPRGCNRPVSAVEGMDASRIILLGDFSVCGSAAVTRLAGYNFSSSQFYTVGVGLSANPDDRPGITPTAIKADGAGKVRVIAGEFEGAKGPAHTFSPLNVWDVRLAVGKTAELPQPAGWTAQLVVLAGTVMVNGEQVLRAAEMATLGTDGTRISIEANADAKLLLLAGEPIDEPVVGYGPFVMNSEQQIVEAIHDFNSGRFGRMA